MKGTGLTGFSPLLFDLKLSSWKGPVDEAVKETGITGFSLLLLKLNYYCPGMVL